jgi:hypothetical protein
VLGAGLVGGGLLMQLVAARWPALVEQAFARSFYSWLGGRLACLTSWLPVSLAETLLLGLGGFGLRHLARVLLMGPRPSAKRLLDGAGALLVIAGILYLTFLVLWGFNYQRQSFAVSAGLEVRPSSVGELLALCGVLVEEANAARAGLPEDAAGVMRLADGPQSTLLRTEAGFGAAAQLHAFLAVGCARPKPLLTSPAFSWLGITGIYSPFTGEPNVNMTLPDPELPFAASHEVAHQRGFAREDEANYLGYVACRLHPDADFRYSGRLAASVYAMNALASRDPAARERLEAGRSAGVARDLAALLAWAERHRGPAERFAARVNDAYLRSQGQREGVESYGRVVDLLLAERRASRPGP